MEDSLLVQQVINGNQAAFKVLVERYQNLVGHIVYKMIRDEFLREEICQDVFMKVYNSLSSFRSESKLSTWIGRIAYNLCIDHLKKKKLPITDIEAQHPEQETIFAIQPEEADNLLQKTDFNHILEGAIETLPEQYRVVLTLYHMDEMSYEEIGKVLQMPDGTVKSYLFRARRMLKNNLLKTYTRKDIRL